MRLLHTVTVENDIVKVFVSYLKYMINKLFYSLAAKKVGLEFLV